MGEIAWEHGARASPPATTSGERLMRRFPCCDYVLITSLRRNDMTDLIDDLRHEPL